MSATVEQLSRLWKPVFGLVKREHAISVVDQAVVSGTSFLTTLLIARYSDAGQLGVYAVGITLLVSLVAFQDSLILQPYIILRHGQQVRPAVYAGTSLTLSGFFSAASALVLIAIAIAMLGWGGQREIVMMTLVVAGIVPFSLTREFARRVAFAHLEIGRALLLDSAIAVVQLSTLIWLGETGRMSALSACLVLGGACAISVAGWFYGVHAEFAADLRHLRPIFRQTWALGKWLVAGRITVQVQGYIIYWITIVLAGSAITGIYAASMSIVSVVNPLIFAIGNVMGPKLVLAWKEGGGRGLWHEAIHYTILVCTLMTLFSLAVYVGGEYVMSFLYHGREYAGHGQLLTVLSLALLAGAAGMPASFALATMTRPRAIVVVGTIAAALSVVLIWILINKFGLLGAAYGLLMGNTAGAIGRWIAFFVFIPADCDSALVNRALQEFGNVPDNENLTIKRVGGGEQAEVFLVGSKSSSPVWHAHQTLVVKIYKPKAQLSFEMVHDQFESLSKLHAALDGLKINGWTISVPRPIYVSKSPLAFVMTAVPGKNIDMCAPEGDVLSPQILHEAARTFAAALQKYWSYGGRHADLGLRNVLFDTEEKVISFIDVGTRESCRTCSDVAKFPSGPASDLAHVLCDVVTDVTDLVGNSARMDKEMFVENVLCAVMDSTCSEKERGQLLNEIRRSLQEHFAECLELSWSLKGVSHRVVKKIAVNRVQSMLQRVVSARCTLTSRSSITRSLMS